MAALTQLNSSQDKPAAEAVQDYSRNHQLLAEFRTKLAVDLIQLENQGQLKDADETLEILTTILHHRLL